MLLWNETAFYVLFISYTSWTTSICPCLTFGWKHVRTFFKDSHFKRFVFSVVTVILYGAGLGLTSYLGTQSFSVSPYPLFPTFPCCVLCGKLFLTPLELYRYNASCYDSESTRICNEYLSSLPLSTITSKVEFCLCRCTNVCSC